LSKARHWVVVPRYEPASLCTCSLSGRYDNPMPESTPPVRELTLAFGWLCTGYREEKDKDGREGRCCKKSLSEAGVSVTEFSQLRA